ncbi:MAG: hypothetical protein M3Y51_03290 [Actinomycetota bacterium]|nr:hypothetical protein [Actinomycetota bacterium]
MTDALAAEPAALDADELDILRLALRRAAGTVTGEALDRALADIGWLDAVALAPRVAVAAVFDAQGAAGSTSAALDGLLLASLGIDASSDVGVVMPAFGSGEPPLRVAPAGVGSTVHGLGSARLRDARAAVLVARADNTSDDTSDDRTRCTTVPMDALERREVTGLDPRLGLVEVRGTVGTDDWQVHDGSWDTAVARCRLALGHELVGTMRTMLALARDHAVERVQFDRPIAGFQAVRHRLAESLVAIEAAEAALDGAWELGSPTAAMIAKAACGHSAATVRRHCQQVLAGIGFTTEHDLHRFVRRSIVLDGLFGDARTLTAAIGAGALDQGHLPPLVPL